ncbi:MAG: imidazole glycerol phosphate synthase subunit HisH, partial [Alistipes sp.]|nr:imidazole glycerol phosphate synthase subunit HisH [Alistipes sp.]
MIAIVDYKMGNLRSVENALRRLGADFTVTADADVIRRADKVLLPGVGNAAEAMDNLRAVGLVEVIRSLRQPVLGICVGMQVMCRHSEEGD